MQHLGQIVYIGVAWELAAIAHQGYKTRLEWLEVAKEEVRILVSFVRYKLYEGQTKT